LLGYAGTILYVDLTTGKTRTEKLSDDVAKKYVGGIGLGMKLYLSNSKAGVEPTQRRKPACPRSRTRFRNYVSDRRKRTRIHI
jgi:aldehyde:ferredoxin oxidoreductase